MGDVNRQIILKSTPEGVPVPENFEMKEIRVAEPGEGEVLVRNTYMSLDPFMRSQMAGRHMSGALHPGDVCNADTVGRVLASRADGFAEGDQVRLHGGWQTHSVAPESAVTKLPDHGVSPSLYLGVLGMPGLTAWASAIHLSDIKAGDVACVSAASGGVGSLWGQIAKISGAEVIGIAGSDEKCAYLTDELGFAGAVNYKTCELKDGLKEAAPDGIDVYHDNVGAEVLEAAMANLAYGARIVLCGLMKQYNAGVPLPGPQLGPIFVARATMRAVIVYDYEDRRAKFEADVARWIKEGRVKTREHMVEGIEAAPDLFHTLMSGKNFGKCVVKLD